jgi:hypothetical protein
MTASDDYQPAALAGVARLASSRIHQPNVCDRGRPDPRAPAQRAAIEGKRAAARERDLGRFVRATAHLPDAVFEDCNLLGVDSAALVGGLGRRRTEAMWRRWYDEPYRRAARTAHEALAERRLAATKRRVAR